MKLVSLDANVLTQMSEGLVNLGDAVETLLTQIGDNRPLNVTSDGKVCVQENLHVDGKIAIGVNNIPSDVSFMSNGAISFDNIKMQSSNIIPETGTYNQGDIVWNNQATIGGYVGWVCIRTGTPGEWKPFGLIAT
jgi:hypothetical protein